MKKKQQDLYVAHALRKYAERIINTEPPVSREEGKALDRALRCCPAISDIDVVWVMWHYHAEKNGWLTTDELKFSGKTGHYYPDYVSED